MNTHGQLLMDLYFDCPLCGHHVDWHYRHSQKSPKPVPCRHHEKDQNTPAHARSTYEARATNQGERCGCAASLPERSFIEVSGF